MRKTTKMPGIDKIKYFSQWDGDNGGARGACGETCLKMIDQYLTGREIPISAIIANGDGNPNITSLAGMVKAANWLGFGLNAYRRTNIDDIKKWLKEGRLVVAVIKYSAWPTKHKQDLSYKSGHFILITAVDDNNNSVRFADPNFWGARRDEGYMNNNKWANFDEFNRAFNHGDGAIEANGTVLVSKKVKEVPAPPAPQPPVDPCHDVKVERDSLKTKLQVEQNNHKKTKAQLGKANNEVSRLNNIIREAREILS